MRTFITTLFLSAGLSAGLAVGLASPSLAADADQSTGSGGAPAATPAVSGQARAPSNPFVVTGAAAPEIKGPSVWGILPWGGIGVGARVMWPLGLPQLLTNARVHDRWALEAGADLLHWSYNYGGPGFPGFNYSWTELVPVVGIMWNVWLNEQFAFYPKAELGYAMGWFSGWQNAGPQPTYGGLFVDGAVGALYKLDGGLTLRGEIGYAGLKLGAGWLF